MTVSKRRTAQTVVSNRIPSRRTALAGAVSLALASSAAMAAYPMNIEPYGKLASEVSSAGVEAVLPLVQSNGSLLFVDGKAAIGSEEYWKVNIGLGYRQQTSDKQWQWGVYGAYDYQNSENDNGFGGATFGGEVRSERFDFRGNYYYPIDDQELVRKTDHFNKFKGYGIYTDGVYDEAMEGFDLEAGARLDIFNTVQTRAFLKGFWYEGDVVPDNNGWQASVELRPQKNLIIEAGYRNDDMFDSQGFLLVKYAFGQPSDKGNLTLDERMVEPWRREDSVIWSGYRSTDGQYAVQVFDSLTHIDSARAPVSGADGTYERPYADSAACLAGGACVDLKGAPAETILMWQGNSPMLPYTPVVLQEGQTLWGQGYDLLADNGITGLTDKFDFGPDMKPVIDPGSGVTDLNDIGAGVRLARDSSVYGVTVAGVAYDSYYDNYYLVPGDGDGIVGSFGEGEEYPEGGDIVIRGNDIFVTGDGIRIEDYNNGGSTTTVEISDNEIVAYYTGIRLYNGAGYYGESTQIVTIADNTIFGKYNGVSATNVAFDGGSATQSIAITNNLIVSDFEEFYRINGRTEAAPADIGIGWGSPEAVYYVGQFASVRLGNFAYNAPDTAEQTVALSGNTIYGGSVGLGAANRAGANATAIQTITSVDDFVIAGKYAGVAAFNEADGPASVATQSVSVDNAGYVVGYYAGVVAANLAFDGGEGMQTVGVTDSYYVGGKYSGAGAYNLAAGTNSSAIQSFDISGNSFVGGDVAGVGAYNEATDGGFAQQTVAVSGNYYVMGHDYLAVGAYNYADESGSQALQYLTVSGNTFVGGDEYGVLVGNQASFGGYAYSSVVVTDNGMIYAHSGHGVAIYNDAELGGDAVQYVDVSGNTIAANDLGVIVDNDAFWADAYQSGHVDNNVIDAGEAGILLDNRAKYYASAEQVLTVSGNTVNAEYDNALRAFNLAEDNSYAEQAITTTGTSLFVSDDEDGVSLENRADSTYYDYSTAIQSWTVSGTTTITSGEDALDLENYANGGYSVATQTVSISGAGTLTGASNGIASDNYANGYESSATQSITLSGTTDIPILVDGNGDDGIRLTNSANGEYSTASSTLNVTNATIEGYYAGIDADSDANGYESVATQSVSVSGSTVTGQNDDGIGLEGVAAGEYSSSTSVLTISSSTVTGSDDGVDADSYANGYESSATQTISVSGSTVTGQDDDGLAVLSRASGEYSSATSTVTIAGSSITGAYQGVDLNNEAEGYYSTAAQTITLSGVTSITGQNGNGLDLFNYTDDDYAVATQTLTTLAGSTLTITGGEGGLEVGNEVYGDYSVGTQTVHLLGATVTGDAGNGADVYNYAGGYYSQAIQVVSIAGSTIRSLQSDAVSLDNYANAPGAIADQTFDLVDGAIDGAEGGVVMVNTGVAGITGASQKFNQDGGTIDSGVGDYAIDADNNGVFAEQNVAVSGVVVNGDEDGLGILLTSDGTDLTAVQGLNLNTGTLYSDDIGVVVNHTGGKQIVSIANETLMADGFYVLNATGVSEEQEVIANTTTVNKPYRNSGDGYMLIDLTELDNGDEYQP